MHHVWKRFFFCAILATATLVLSVQQSHAQTNPSAESCSGVGMLDVKCYNCETGGYLGMINVQAGYNGQHEDCMKSISEAKDRCAGAYNVPKNNIGMKWEYDLGLTHWNNWNPRSNCPCVQ